MNHHTINEYDMFSDHIPVKFEAKIDFTLKTVRNEI